jgi:hypothetical protein
MTFIGNRLYLQYEIGTKRRDGVGGFIIKGINNDKGQCFYQRKFFG